MRLLIAFLILSFLVIPNEGYSVQDLKLNDIVKSAEDSSVYVARRRRRGSSMNRTNAALLKRAASLADAGQYDEASKLYYRMSKSRAFRSKYTEIKYILGQLTLQMKLYQVSAFFFYDVIKREARRSGTSRKYIRKALEKLSLITNILDNDVLLKFAISKIEVRDFPRVQKDLFYFRLGEVQLKAGKFADAAKIFGRVRSTSSFFPIAKYRQGLAYAEMNRAERAISAFEDLEQHSAGDGVTDPNRVNAVLGQARVFYQKKDFARAIELYREIPRDTVQWHDSLFERSWAMLQSGQFRSALSNFHTLHSSYYEDYYLPESLVLRGIVYLYICKWDEMAKVLNIFNRIYNPVRRRVIDYVRDNDSSEAYLRELARIKIDFDNRKKGIKSQKSRLPYIIGREVLRDGDIIQSINYLNKIGDELELVAGLPQSWRRSGIGQFAIKALQRRQVSTQSITGRLVKRRLSEIRSELRDLSEQNDFLRLEQVSGQKELVKKQIAGRGLPDKKVDEDSDRDFYVDNGYEYWPFEGEYWLDELGNYHYVGLGSCRQ